MTNLKQDFGSRYRATNDWRADVPLKTKPLITGTKTIKGVKHYMTAEGKLFVSKIFNQMWGEPKLV